MATNFKNKVGTNIGTTPVTLVTVGGAAKVTVIGMSLTNLTDGVVVASVMVTDELNNTGHYVKNVPIPANQSLRIINGGEKLILAPDNSISIVANQDSALDVIVSYVEIV
jgi:hypothetical protein